MGGSLSSSVQAGTIVEIEGLRLPAAEEGAELVPAETDASTDGRRLKPGCASFDAWVVGGAIGPGAATDWAVTDGRRAATKAAGFAAP